MQTQGNQMTEKINSCVDCKYYFKPSWFEKNFTSSPFKDKCSHPFAKDEIDGMPAPCVTVRLNICSGGILFSKKG